MCVYNLYPLLGSCCKKQHAWEEQERRDWVDLQVRVQRHTSLDWKQTASSVALHRWAINSVSLVIPIINLYNVTSHSMFWDSISNLPEDPGPRDPRPMDPNWHTLYMYIHSTCISNHSTGMHYGMDYEILCTVRTFVLAAFVPFHSVRHQKRPWYGVTNGVH